MARNGPSSFTGRFYVSLGARLAPGGPVSPRHPERLAGRAAARSHVTGTVKHAASCQLELLSRQSFPVVYSHNPTTACRNGSYSAHVTIGANPSAVKRTVAFALVARNGPIQLHRPVLRLARRPLAPRRPVGPRHPERIGAERRPGRT